MGKFENTIQAWYDSGERHFKIGEHLSDSDYLEMPCYHFRMSAEIFLKGLNLLYMEDPDLKHFDKFPTHEFSVLRKGIRDSIAPIQASILRQSARVFRVKYPHYKYVISRNLKSPQSPSSLFSKKSVELHQNAAESVLKVARDCLNERLPTALK